MDTDEITEAINTLLRDLDDTPGIIGRWVLAYEVDGIAEDGEFGHSSGYIAQASPASIVGMCTLAIADATRLHQEGED